MGFRKRQRRNKQAKRAAARPPIELGDTRQLSATALLAIKRRSVRAVVVMEQSAEFVAELQGVHPRTVRIWVSDYRERGEEALQFPKRRGRKPSHPLDDDEQREVVAHIREGTPESCGLGNQQTWTRKLVGQLIEERLGKNQFLSSCDPVMINDS